MKVLFIGQNGPFTMLPLRAVATEHTIVGIVQSVPHNYRPVIDKIKRALDKGKDNQSLRSFASQISVPYYLLKKGVRNDLANFVLKLKPDIICVASMSELLKEEVFSIPPYGAINFHPALLPNYRGPKSLFWCYYFMESQAGATIHYIDKGEDTGDIIKQRSIPIYLGMQSDELVKKIISAGTALMLEALADISRGTVNKLPQKNLNCPFRARRLGKDEQLLQWNWPIERVWHFMRGTRQRNQELNSKLPGLSWTAKEFRKCDSDGSSGKFRWSFKGCLFDTQRRKNLYFTSLVIQDFLRDGYHLFLNLSGKD